MDDSWLTLILLGLAASWMPLIFGVEIYALGDNDGVKKVSSLLGGVTSFRLLVSVGVLLLVAGVLTTLSQGLSDIGQFLGSSISQLGADVTSGQHLFVDLLLIAAGLVLVIQAIRRLRSGSDADEKSQTGDDKALTVGATGMLGLGMLMAATNAEQWILMSAAVNQVLRMEVEPWRQLFAFLLFLALSSLLILLPLLLYLVRPQQAGAYLGKVNGWINGSMRYVASGILALIGIYLVWKGGIGALHFQSGWLGG